MPILDGDIYVAGPYTKIKWEVRCFGDHSCISTHDTKLEAWKEARRLARARYGKAILLNCDGECVTHVIYQESEE